MQVKVASASGTSCNFCQRGELVDNHMVRPYDYVFDFTADGSSGLAARICHHCLDELYAKAKQLTS